MELNGLKEAVKEYQKYNADGPLSPEYGALMFDKADGSVWTDYFYSLGHNEWKVYHSKSIINLGFEMESQGIEVTVSNAKQFINDLLSEVDNG